MLQRTILLVDDDLLLRDLLSKILSQYNFVVHVAANASQAMRVGNNIDGAIIDVDLGPGGNGFDLADALRMEKPDLGIVFLTKLSDPRFAGRNANSLPAGISYVQKSQITDITVLIRAIDATMRGQSRDMLRHDKIRDRPLAGLTPRQLVVLGLVADGRTNQQISEALSISIRAVEDLVSRIVIALNLGSPHDVNVRVAAARRYLEAAHGVASE